MHPKKEVAGTFATQLFVDGKCTLMVCIHVMTILVLQQDLGGSVLKLHLLIPAL